MDNNNEIKKIGLWISIQQINYKKKVKIMKIEEIYNKWTEFINNDKYKIYFKVKEANTIIWINKLEKVKDYINKNKKKPSVVDKNKEIQKIAYWMTHNYRYYRHHSYIMKNKIIYNKYTEFIKDEKYNKYYYWK